MMRRLLIILGPTSTGKTDFAFQLANKFQGELISVDSRQVYKDLDIGTGKLPSELKIENLKLKIEKGNGWWRVNGRKVWMYDVADPKKQYSVYNFVKDASKVIDEIIARGKLPIITGGTGLYLKALLYGLPNLSVPLDLKLRKKLQSLSILNLQNRLKKISPKRWEKMNNSDRKNPRRLVRAIELEAGFKKKKEELIGLKKGLSIFKIGLRAPRQMLYKRIDERVNKRLEEGMIEEAKKLHAKGLSFKRMRQLGLEYGVLADYLEKGLGKEILIKVLQEKIHGFAKRQMTWFKKEKNVFWFDITQKGWQDQVESKVNSWYHSRE